MAQRVEDCTTPRNPGPSSRIDPLFYISSMSFLTISSSSFIWAGVGARRVVLALQLCALFGREIKLHFSNLKPDVRSLRAPDGRQHDHWVIDSMNFLVIISSALR